MSKIPLNLPNRLTLARIVLIPIYLGLMAIGSTVSAWLAAIVFLIAALTDMLDGQIARRRDEVTDFGKFIDPIADKLLVLLPMILIHSIDGDISVWAVIIMVAREIIVSGFRLVAVTGGKVIAAGYSGKIKTVLQIISVLMLTLSIPFARYAAWLAALASAYSGFEIIYRNRKVLESTI